MPVHEGQYHPESVLLERTYVLSVQSVGNSEADTLFDSIKPGFEFEIVAVEHFAEAVTATADYMVKIGTTDALAAREVPTADTREDAGLHATEANLRGDETDEINLHATTDGTGVFTGLKVKVTVKVYPAGGYAEGVQTR